jgi:hypothetical protein
MQLELSFLERPTPPPPGSSGLWNEIDPQAQIVALGILARLIARMLASRFAEEAGHE